VVLTVAGALAGWMISHVYYLRALNDMKADAEERQRAENLVFRGIESIGTLRYTHDSSGKVVAVAIELGGDGGSTATATGTLSVTPASPAQR
jgi:hypothetical protein